MDSKIYVPNEFYNSFIKYLFQVFETFQNVFQLFISKPFLKLPFLIWKFEMSL